MRQCESVNVCANVSANVSVSVYLKRICRGRKLSDASLVCVLEAALESQFNRWCVCVCVFVCVCVCVC